MSLNKAQALTLMNTIKAKNDKLALSDVIKGIDYKINQAVISGLPSVFIEYVKFWDGMATPYSKELYEYYSGLQFNVTSNKEGLLISWI